MHRFGLILVSLLLATPALGGTATAHAAEHRHGLAAPARSDRRRLLEDPPGDLAGSALYTWTKASGSLPGGVSLGSGRRW